MSKVKLELLITNDLNEEFSGLFYFNSKFLFSDIKDVEENNYYGIKLDKNGIDFLEESQKCCHEDI